MIGFIKDVSELFALKLPPGFSRKYLVVNFLVLYAKSVLKRMGRKPLPVPSSVYEVQPDSEIWSSFYKILTLYIRYLEPEYLLRTYMICYAASGWLNESHIQALRDRFIQEDRAIVPPSIAAVVRKISDTIEKKFYGVQSEAINQWLLTYQYALKRFGVTESDLRNTMIVELGGGVGGNITVHAALSQTEVCVFDIPPMLEVQKRLTSKVAEVIPLQKISYFHDPKKLIEYTKGKEYIVVSYWAFTEFPENLRETLEPLIRDAKMSLFASNTVFEGIDNFQYLDTLKDKLQKKVQSQPVPWNPRHNFVSFS